MEPMDTNNSDEEEDSCTPPEICEEANIATHNLLPEKSKALYESCYNNFQDWKKTSNTKSSSERVLMAYFKKLPEQYKPSTLWAQYSMLKTTIKIYEKLDIKKYYTLSAFMKKQSHGFKSKKSKVLTTEDVDKFLNEAPDDEYLLMKVALIFGVCGALRKDELTNIKVNDIERHGDLILVRIPDTKTAIARSFTISKEFQNTVKKYQDLRPPHTRTDRFFLNYRNSKCTVQVVGKNRFGTMPKTIASYLGLPDKDLYTGHCFRRTSATILADTGANITTLKRHGGWKSTTVAEGYIEESMQNKSKIGGLISSAISSESSKSTEIEGNNRKTSNANEPLPKEPLQAKMVVTSESTSALQGSAIEHISPEETDSPDVKKYFNFHNCAHITIKYKGV